MVLLRLQGKKVALAVAAVFNKCYSMGQEFQDTSAVWRGFLAFGEPEHRPSSLISTSGNFANTVLICQAKVIPTLETNKQTNHYFCEIEMIEF